MNDWGIKYFLIFMKNINLNLNHLATKLSHILLFLSQFLKQFMNLKLILQRKDKDVESECIIDSQNRDKRGKYIVKYNCEAESDDKPEAVGNRDELPWRCNNPDRGLI